MHPNKAARDYIGELESIKAQELAQVLVDSDYSLTQIHVALSIVHEAIETECSLLELKQALYAAIRVRRD
jgi:hypothetical protein